MLNAVGTAFRPRWEAGVGTMGLPRLQRLRDDLVRRALVGVAHLPRRATDPHAVRREPSGPVTSIRLLPEIRAVIARAGPTLLDPRVVLGEPNSRGETNSV